MPQFEILPKPVQQAIKILDGISIISGKLFSWLVFPMAGALVYEVIARYVFNKPTIWAEDISFILYGMYFMLGAAYTLQRGMHIRTDFLYRNWSIRTRGLVDSSLYLFVFFPALVAFLMVGWEFAYTSILINESYPTSPWMPLIWPLKLAIPVSTLLLILQGVSEFLKSFYTFTTGIALIEDGEIET